MLTHVRFPLQMWHCKPNKNNQNKNNCHRY